MRGELTVERPLSLTLEDLRQRPATDLTATPHPPNKCPRRRLWQPLVDAGGEVRCFNPPRLASPFGWLARDHRKLGKEMELFARQAKEVDIVITTALIPGRAAPELWTEAMFSKMYRALKKNGVLTTYAAKGSVRRAMQAVGLQVERLPGPPGKREMLRARKV